MSLPPDERLRLRSFGDAAPGLARVLDELERVERERDAAIKAIGEEAYARGRAEACRDAALREVEGLKDDVRAAEAEVARLEAASTRVDQRDALVAKLRACQADRDALRAALAKIAKIAKP